MSSGSLQRRRLRSLGASWLTSPRGVLVLADAPDGPRALPRYARLPDDPPSLRRFLLQWQLESGRASSSTPDDQGYDGTGWPEEPR